MAGASVIFGTDLALLNSAQAEQLKPGNPSAQTSATEFLANRDLRPLPIAFDPDKALLDGNFSVIENPIAGIQAQSIVAPSPNQSDLAKPELQQQSASERSVSRGTPADRQPSMGHSATQLAQTDAIVLPSLLNEC